jgi:uncharacterized protein
MNVSLQPKNLFQRIFNFPLTRIIIGFAWIVGIYNFTEILLHFLPTVLRNIISLPVILVIVFFAYYAFVSVMEKRPLLELSAKGSIQELVAGIAIGATLFTITIGILWVLGYYQIIATNNWTVALPAFKAAVMAGFLEEILIRGILFRIMESSLGTWLALFISAMFFGFSHLANPNATILGATAIALEAGILLAAAFLLTRRLWLAIGLHFAWNFTQSGIFGVAVSGLELKGVFDSTLSGPAWLSGGAFGAESSVIAVLVCLSVGLYILWRAYKKGNFVKPFWRS